jgi:hypothetical protein
MAAGPDPGVEDESAPDEADQTPVMDEDDMPAEPPDDGRSMRLVLACREVLFKSLERMSKRLGGSAQTAAAKPWEFLAWINDLEERHGAVIRSELAPAAGLLAASNGQTESEVLALLSGELFTRARDVFLAAAEVPAEDLIASVTEARGLLESQCRDLSSNWIMRGERNGSTHH